MLVHLDKTEIPRYNIKHRGTKEAGQSPGSSTSANGTMAMSETTDYMQKMLLLKRLVELANSRTTLGEGVFFEAMQAMDRISSYGDTEDNSNNNRKALGNIDGGGVMPITCPPRPSRRGRPQNTSLHSWEVEQHKEKQQVIVKAGEQIKETTDEENPKGGKT